MSRSTYIYLVGPVDADVVYAAFTVKHEAHTWAYWSQYRMAELELSRMRDNPGGKSTAERVAIPWDKDFEERQKQKILARGGVLNNHVV